MTGTNACPNCGSEDTDDSIDGLEPVCNACGLVIHGDEDLLEEAIPVEDKPETSTTESIPEWDSVYTVQSSTEKRVASALEMIEDVAGELRLTSEIKERSAEVFCSAMRERLTDGRKSEVVVLGAICVACREQGQPRPLTHIAQSNGCSESDVDAVVRLLQQKVRIELPIPEPSDYLSYLGKVSDYDQEVITEAKNSLAAIQDDQVVNGKSPVGVVAAALYGCSEGEISQRALARQVGVTKETIRVRLNDLRACGAVS